MFYFRVGLVSLIKTNNKIYYKKSDQWVKSSLEWRDQLDIYNNIHSKFLTYHASLIIQTVFQNFIF